MDDHNDEDASRLQPEQPRIDPDEPEGLTKSVRRRAQRRILGAGVVVAVVAGIGALVAIGGGGVPANSAAMYRAAEEREIGSLLAGIPQRGNALGSSTAPVTLQYFGDLQCSTARAFTLGALPHIIGQWVRPGKVRMEYRALRTVSGPRTFDDQQDAALAAGMQNKLWYYVEDFYHEQGLEHSGYVTEGYLTALAQQVPALNLERWSRDRHEPQLTAQVIKDEEAAHAARLDNTPSFLIGRTGSVPTHTLDQSSALDDAAFDEAVRQILYDQPDQGR